MFDICTYCGFTLYSRAGLLYLELTNLGCNLTTLAVYNLLTTTDLQRNTISDWFTFTCLTNYEKALNINVQSQKCMFMRILFLTLSLIGSSLDKIFLLTNRQVVVIWYGMICDRKVWHLANLENYLLYCVIRFKGWLFREVLNRFSAIQYFVFVLCNLYM